MTKNGEPSPMTAIGVVRRGTQNAVEALSAAIFEKGRPTVVEAYSAFGRPQCCGMSPDHAMYSVTYSAPLRAAR
jgi:hypothetical protein